MCRSISLNHHVGIQARTGLVVARIFIEGRSNMKKLKTMIIVIRQTGADTLIGAYLVFLMLCALLIWIAESEITTYRDALWYCFTVASTVGFGDIVVHMPISRILSVVLSLYSAVMLAIIASVFVSYFNQIMQLRQKDSLATLVDKLDRLPDMSKEELKRLSELIRKKLNHQ